MHTSTEQRAYPAFTRVVGIAGSPSPRSRSSWLLALAQSHLHRGGATCASIRVNELPCTHLLAAETSHPEIREALTLLVDAQIVVVSTPIYKAAYSGLLKVFLDMLPMDALRGKTVLPIATGGSAAHLRAVDYALKPVLSALGAHHILPGLFAADCDLVAHGTLGYVPEPGVLARLERSLEPLLDLTATHRRKPPELARCD